MLISASWCAITDPKPKSADAKRFAALQSIVQSARTIIAEEQLPAPTILVQDHKLEPLAPILKRLSRARDIQFVEQGSGLYLDTNSPAWIQATDRQIHARKDRLTKSLVEKETYLKSLESRLNNPGYMKSAPANIVEDTKIKASETTALIQKTKEQLSALNHA